jgi:hypothetical protein
MISCDARQAAIGVSRAAEPDGENAMTDGKAKGGKQGANPVPASHTDEVRYLTRKHWLRTQQTQQLMLRAEPNGLKVNGDTPRRSGKS